MRSAVRTHLASAKANTSCHLLAALNSSVEEAQSLCAEEWQRGNFNALGFVRFVNVPDLMLVTLLACCGHLIVATSGLWKDFLLPFI